jgi:hypothetical protein
MRMARRWLEEEVENAHDDQQADQKNDTDNP